MVTDAGYGKRTPIEEYPVKGRGAMGVKTIGLTEKKGGVAAALIVREHHDLVFISQNGMVQRTGVKGVSKQGRPRPGRPPDEPARGRPGQRRGARDGVGGGHGAREVAEELPEAGTPASTEPDGGRCR